MPISEGHANMNTLAASAGFTIFFPMPPKSCFTTTIAKNAPATGSHSGTEAERFIPMRSPVSAAEKSATVTLRRSIFCVAHSKKTDEIIEMIIIAAARSPKT